MEEVIRKLHVGNDCYLPLKRGIGSTVTCVRNLDTRRKNYTVEIKQGDTVLYDKWFTTINAVVRWYKEMAK